MSKTVGKTLLFVCLICAWASTCSAQVGSDLWLAPAGFDAVCALPDVATFDVTVHGAKGDGVADDTAAIRKALAAAAKNSGGIVYFPKGTYKVCPQPGDNYKGQIKPIFNIASSKIVFAGDGPGKSVLSGFCTGMSDPKTSWVVIGKGYSKIQRFAMFAVNYYGYYDKLRPINTFQVRSLTVDGNAGYTGNFKVGGDPATGDGWDVTHKCVTIAGDKPISDVLIFNAELCNWRGEIVYSGAASVPTFNIVRSEIYGTNASAVSVGGCVLKGCHIGGLADNKKVANGVENYCRKPGSSTRVLDTVIQGASNGVVHLGLPGTSCLVDGSQFSGCHYGIMFSEVASNVVIRDSQFTDNVHCSITSVLGIYPKDPKGFSGFDFNRNTVTKSGALFLNQNGDPKGKDTFDDLWIRNNSIGPGSCLLQGGFYGLPYKGFCVDGNIINAGANDVASSGYRGQAARWLNTTRAEGSIVGVRVEDYSNDSTTLIEPVHDMVRLNVHPNSEKQWAAIDPATLGLYPPAFQTTIFSTSPGWLLKSDPTWNTFAADVPVPAAGVMIRKGTSGKFDLVP